MKHFSKFHQDWASFRSKAGIAACLAALIVVGPAQSEDKTDWRAIARSDIEAAQKLMLENHPGPVDPENPDFNRIAEKAYRDALALADKVDSELGYIYAMFAYTAGLRDGHFAVIVSPPKDTQAYWPGIVTGWRADKFTVTGAAEDERRLVGDELVSCDGKSANKMMLENIFRFRTGKPDQPAYWAREAPFLLYDRGNPFVARATKCVFKKPDGEKTTETLNWRKSSPDIAKLLTAARFGPTPAPGLHQFGPGRYWINLSNFDPHDGDEIKAVQDSIAAVKAHRDELRNAEAIVIDMRGNQGGSSQWGYDFADALWGEQYRRWRQPPDASAVDWRVSPENLRHVESFKEMFAREGHEAEFEKYIAPIISGMKKALAAGEPFYRETDDGSEPRPKGPIEDPVKAKVFFLTHGFCASACLDAADLILAMENVTQVGYPTSSDSNYMEVNIVELPSGKTKLVVPIKVYRGRPRANGAYYDPKIRYDGFDWSDKAMEDWMNKVIDGKIK